MLFMTRHPDEMVERLREIDERISDLRCEQAVLVNELDKTHVAGRDGHRSINDWLAATLDMSRANASDLVYAGRHLGKHRSVNFRLADGDISFDRAVAVMRLAEAGADPATLDASNALDLAGVGRLTAKQRKVTRRSEHQAFTDRHVTVQPNLDETVWRLTGLLPAVDGRIVADALDRRADELRLLPYADTHTRGQLQADALVAMATDSLNHHNNGDSPDGGRVTVFVDLDRANSSGGEHGAEVAYGPRVGPAVLEELLCTGTVQVVGLDNGTPVTTSDATRAIPPSIRAFVAHRDGGCTVAGCTSRYRLEPHHITPRSQGGSHDPDNLTTLCWFHHHVVIHGRGFGIDPASPPGRRRLLPPGPGP